METPTKKDEEIEHKLSVTVHRFIINTKMKLEEIAFSTPNCVISNESPWRCTYYGKDFTSNIFIAKKLPYYALVAMSFSKNKSFDSYKEDYKKLLKADPNVTLQDFTLINWVEKFYTPYNSLSLNTLETILYKDDEDIFISKIKKKGRQAKVKPDKIKSYDQVTNDDDGNDSDYTDEYRKSKKRKITIGDDDGKSPKVNMDQQKFSALAVHPFPKESNFVIEVYTTGKLNVAGIPNEEYFNERVKPYINGKFASFLNECNLGQNVVIDDLIDEFTF